MAENHVEILGAVVSTCCSVDAGDGGYLDGPDRRRILPARGFCTCKGRRRFRRAGSKKPLATLYSQSRKRPSVNFHDVPLWTSVPLLRLLLTNGVVEMRAVDETLGAEVADRLD